MKSVKEEVLKEMKGLGVTFDVIRALDIYEKKVAEVIDEAYDYFDELRGGMTNRVSIGEYIKDLKQRLEINTKRRATAEALRKKAYKK